MFSSSNGPSFLTSHVKKYGPSFEWNDEERLLQDPKTHAPYSHMDIKETHEYKDLQLLLALSECFWDTTCTSHFSGIGEVLLTPYDFSVITDLRLDGETSNEIKKLLGVVTCKMRTKNIPLMWLCKNITKCDIVAMGTHMLMLLFIGTFLCPDLGSTVNLRYLWSLRNIEQIKNYDWGGMAYTTLLYFMTQLSRRSLSSLGGVPFFFWLDCNGIVNFCQVWMYEYFGVGLEIWEEINDIFPRFLCWLPKHRLSTSSRRSLEIWCLVIDNLTANDMSLDPWVGCEEYDECERALELNSCQVLFECGHGRLTLALLFQEYQRLILNLFELICKVVWPAYWYFSSLLKSIFHLAYSFSTFMLGVNICMLDFQAPSSEGEERGEEEEEISSPHYAGISSSSFMETYSHFSAWRYEVMNPDGTYNSMPLDRPKHTPNVPWPDSVDVDLVEESMQMIRVLQLLARTQSS
ncbi:hypothetical protein SO802_022252 [Lithocarpus litseifolius]|uniref:Aminotransferase-like plant mobile domain-containing protein n=1 Tax=Lithocarpus litseifolius TaxID=425828 RepID=A0AAW2CHE2_9ROSI